MNEVLGCLLIGLAIFVAVSGGAAIGLLYAKQDRRNEVLGENEENRATPISPPHEAD